MRKEIVTSNAPTAIGAYSQGIESSGTVFTSGQLPIDPCTNTMASEISEQTKQSLENIKAILRQAGKDFSNVVKTTVFLDDMNSFDEMNEVYKEYFSKPFPVRTCVAVKALPKNAKVEIEVIAE